jgi:hypothetical protein
VKETGGLSRGQDPDASGRQLPVITTADGIRFCSRELPFRLITDVPDYRFTDIRPDDVVVDIGANAGAFALRAARVARRVVAVEPVTTDVLSENIRLNGAAVQVIRGALGDGRAATIRWDDASAEVPSFTLRQIRAIAGGCDFLKCDCEGAEWGIDPADLDGIRRIEMELHLPPICERPDPALLDYIGRHYDFTITRVPCHGPLGLMGYLHAEKKE